MEQYKYLKYKSKYNNLKGGGKDDDEIQLRRRRYNIALVCMSKILKDEGFDIDMIIEKINENIMTESKDDIKNEIKNKIANEIRKYGLTDREIGQIESLVSDLFKKNKDYLLFFNRDYKDRISQALEQLGSTITTVPTTRLAIAPKAPASRPASRPAPATRPAPIPGAAPVRAPSLDHIKEEIRKSMQLIINEINAKTEEADVISQIEQLYRDFNINMYDEKHHRYISETYTWLNFVKKNNLKDDQEISNRDKETITSKLQNLIDTLELQYLRETDIQKAIQTMIKDIDYQTDTKLFVDKINRFLRKIKYDDDYNFAINYYYNQLDFRMRNINTESFPFDYRRGIVFNLLKELYDDKTIEESRRRYQYR